jgi:uncharacterized protein (DUF1697 family)
MPRRNMGRAPYRNAMPAVICMLRGVNVGGRNKIKMEALRALCESLRLKSPKTYLQSGNVVFLCSEKNLAALSKRIQDAFCRKFGFRLEVILRTSAEMRRVIDRDPFARPEGVEPAKLLVTFLAEAPGKVAVENLLKLDTHGEEIYFQGNELYLYFRNGIGQTKLSWAAMEKALNVSYTGRNWNTVNKLSEMAEALEGEG